MSAQENDSFFRDLKDLGAAGKPARRRPRRRWRYLALVSLAGLVFWLGQGGLAATAPVLLSWWSPPAAGPGVAAPPGTSMPTTTATAAVPDAAAAPAVTAAEPDTDTPADLVVTVRRGDTLEAIFRRLGLGLNQAYEVSRLPQANIMNHLRPGRRLTVRADPGGRLQTLRYDLDLATHIEIRRRPAAAGDGPPFEVARHTREFETRLRYVDGRIESSLFLAGQRTGLSNGLIMQLVEIFGWDIDFALDLRQDDRFAVIYEEKYWRGEKVADGDVVAAEFVNRGRHYRAIRHIDEEGQARYYTPAGVSMRKTFLRTPVQFTRISSGFSWGRYHPVLKRWRAHKGVDYAAPRGTPVRATADGRIAHLGNKGGYGRTVIIKHGGSYSTLYAHLSRYRSGLRRGGRVRQGQVIGYVGRSGLATGPHLHYEFRVNGSHINPLRFKQPKAEPIPARYRQTFLEAVPLWQARLDLLGRREAPVVIAEQTPAPGTRPREL